MLASLANIGVTVGASLLLIVVWDQGALGLIAGNFTGTLVVYLALLGYRRAQLGFDFSRAAPARDEPLRHPARARPRSR